MTMTLRTVSGREPLAVWLGLFCAVLVWMAIIWAGFVAFGP